MSGGFPLFGSLGRNYSTGITPIALATPGSNNSKGAYTTLVSSTAFDATWALISTDGQYNSSYTGAIDFAVGAASAEQIFLNNLIVLSWWIPFTTKFRSILVPVTIPAGSRVSARCQMSSIAAVNPPKVMLRLFDSDFIGPTSSAVIDAIGFTSGSTQGTTITPGNSSKGSYAQLIASTSYDYSGFFLAYDPLGSPSQNNTDQEIDVAVGSSGSEKIIVPDWTTFMYSGNSQMGDCYSPIFRTPIPAGSRISARASADGATGTIGLTLYGLRQ